MNTQGHGRNRWEKQAPNTDKPKCSLRQLHKAVSRHFSIPVTHWKVCDLANVKGLISRVDSRDCIKRPKVSVVSHLVLNECNVFLSCFKLCFCGAWYLKDLSDQPNPSWYMNTDYFVAILHFLDKVSAEHITSL